ncbi:hypothetical protein L226DRAFT_289961 [Lentinus tigrinus ALCF2SS1-7]|uniref:uncharacterized protein n=1 Tax=Lentinus tigrinus ALCF2SS1-7 TaxID=1328758 RepID=UPI001165DF89|nr:hypothetical protein L226DRAFT_289961 [Lentinus tigrinus ALCF2SS1-7]
MLFPPRDRRGEQRVHQEASAQRGDMMPDIHLCRTQHARVDQFLTRGRPVRKQSGHWSPVVARTGKMRIAYHQCRGCGVVSLMAVAILSTAATMEPTRGSRVLPKHILAIPKQAQ